MALRFRRGLDIERQAVVFVEGEPTYTTDNKEFFIGDGVTPGGIQIGGINDLIDDITPRLGGNLDLNNNNIIGSGDIVINGDLKITGSIDVGLITANYTGSLFGDDSTLIVDAINKRVYADVMALDGTTLVDTTSKEIDLSSTSLSSLSDVQYDNPSPGALLSWNGTYFSLNALGASENQIVLDKQLLQYDTSLGWIASDQITLPDSSVLVDIQTGIINLYNTPLDSHRNVLNNDLTIDDVLAWDGINWINKQLTIDNANISVETLDDVTINNIQVGDSLEWNGTFWTNVDASEQNELQNLTDVILDNPQINDVLTWNGGQWINLQGGQTDEIGDLNDVVLDNVQLGDVLEWSGAAWTNIEKDTTSILSDLDDVLLDNYQVGDILAFDGVNWVNQEYDQIVEISDLSDVLVDSQGVGDVLTWDGMHWVASTNDYATILQDLTDVQISFPQPNDSLTYNGTTWVNTAPVQINDYTGTFQGDLLGFDSTMIVDAGNNTVFGTLQGDVVNNNITTKNIRIEGNEVVETKFIRNAAADPAPGDDIIIGQHIYQYSTPTITDAQRHFVIGSRRGIFHFMNVDEVGFAESHVVSFRDGNVGIKTTTPTDTLHVEGSGKFTSSVQFGSLTTTQRDALTAADGMIVYNSTTNKFQGFANGTWVDLH